MDPGETVEIEATGRTHAQDRVERVARVRVLAPRASTRCLEGSRNPTPWNEYHAIFGGERCFAVHPSDTAPALVALGARARVVGRQRDDLLPVESLYVRPADDPTRETVLGPGDILTEVRIPPLPGWRSVFRKARARRVWDFALASVAVAIRESGDEIDGARIALGGVSLVPWRATDGERTLVGARLTPVRRGPGALGSGPFPRERCQRPGSSWRRLPLVCVSRGRSMRTCLDAFSFG